MHRSILGSHSESLVANNEYAALVTLRYLLMPLVVNAQGNLKHNSLAIVNSGCNLAFTNVLCNAKC
jgi:hypothetical protein